MDEVEQWTLRTRPVETVPGSTSRLRRALLQEVGRLTNPQAADAFRQRLSAQFDQVERAEDRDVVRVGLVGDPFTLSCEFANGSLEQELGGLGVEVVRSFWMSEAVRLDPVTLIIGGTRNREATRAAAPFLERDVGGLARRSLGEAVRLSEARCDGLIHVAPFTCLPEVMIANMLDMLHRHAGVPLMHLSLDEQTSSGGLQTRLEAFVDLMRQRRCSPARRLAD